MFQAELFTEDKLELKNGNTLLHRLFIDIKSHSVTSIKLAIAFLMDRGADPSIKNNNGQTVSDVAIKNGWDDLLYMLK